MKGRRRKYIVNLKFQGKFILGYLFISLFGSVGATVLFSFLAHRKLEELIWRIHGVDLKMKAILLPLFIQVNIVYLLFISVLLVAVGLWMLHQVSDPISHLIERVKAMGDGDLSSDVFLKHDPAFQEVAKTLKVSIANNRERFKQIRNDYLAVSRTLAEIEADSEKRSHIKVPLEEVIASVKKIRRNITAKDFSEVAE